MKIELKELTIREVSKNYVDNAEEGVLGYDGKLNIRPKYQREFVFEFVAVQIHGIFAAHSHIGRTECLAFGFEYLEKAFCKAFEFVAIRNVVKYALTRRT